MQRTIVTISDRDGQLVAWLDKAGPQLADARLPLPLGYGADNLPAVDSAAGLNQYGDKLVQGLQQHPAISQVLKEIFAAGPAQSYTLCFGIEAPAGQQIRWESLRDQQGRFVALEGRCHIGRIAEETSSREAGVRPFDAPLRLLAFLSGAKLDATLEWAALTSAIDRATGRGLPIQARVCIGQPALLQQARDEIAGGLHTGLQVAGMPADDAELQDEIHDMQPHLLHFFCHGKAQMGAAYLELATAIEHATGAANGSVNIPVDTLVNHPDLANAWLVVLNCCEGARASEQLDSMAYRMVSQGGLAAAIGMLEPVAVGEANRFCAALYPELFRALEAALKMAPGAAPVTVDLSQVMSRPRRALRDMLAAAAAEAAAAAAPADAGNGVAPAEPEADAALAEASAAATAARWTLPVLYLQEQPFQVYRPVASPDSLALLRQRADLIAGMLRILPPNTPDEARDRMLAMLDEAPRVPEAMRPDRWGRVGAEAQDAAPAAVPAAAPQPAEGLAAAAHAAGVNPAGVHGGG